MAPANKPESYGPSDYSEILKEGETLGVLVGGMAVNVWANHYLDPIRKAFRADGFRFSATGGPAYGWQASGFRLPTLPMSRY